MNSDNSLARIEPSEDHYAAAYGAWRRALDHYLQLARDEASASKLRAAIAAVHAAALQRDRLAGPAHERPR